MATDLLPVSGAILAGGESRRMGKNKALLELDGKSLIERLVLAFEELFAEVFVVANDPAPYEAISSRIVPDLYPGLGPLAGIHSALRHARHEWVFVSGCDSPFVNQVALREMAGLREGVDAVLAETEDGLHPLSAFYARACLDPIEDCLEGGRLRVVGFHPEIRRLVIPADQARQWDPWGRMFLNINTPADYENALDSHRELTHGK